ncbi:MAG: hypothetical protein HY552_02345 [Elusimicrobia bacterium]|nr:hypothetical protein [Elusimicrobiota bacterium]
MTRRICRAVLLALLELPIVSFAAGAAPTKEASFSGRFYGMEGRLMHTWDFNEDGTFYHATIASGAGTSVRSGERGRFAVEDGVLTLRVQKTASGFVTPGVGGRTTQVGGGAQDKEETRRLRLKRSAQGVVLDGVALKVKSW